MRNKINTYKQIANTSFNINRRELKPQLFWPVYSNQNGRIYEKDSLEFPPISQIYTSLDILTKWWEDEDQRFKQQKKPRENHSSGFIGSSIFWETFFQSRSVILIDKFFRLTEWDTMIHKMREADPDMYPLREVKIICGNGRDFYAECDAVQKEFRKNIVICSDHKDKFRMHDRFAIMDNEIWHFGSTIGGAKAHINAFSRGWEDKDDNLRKYAEYVISSYK